MKKGYLDKKKLEGYKKADLQELAQKLGVSSEGTIKEIAARCATVEVELPDTEEQDEIVTVEVQKVYRDLELKRTVFKGECLPMKKTRADEIVALKLGKIVAEK